MLTTDELTASKSLEQSIATARRAAEDLRDYCDGKRQDNEPSSVWAKRHGGLRRIVATLQAQEKELASLFS